MDSRSFFRPSGGGGQNGLADMDVKSAASDHRKLQEFHEEEERMKLRMLQADAGLIQPKDILVTAERMDWMYHNPAAAAQKKENEDYLLGKSLQTPDEREEMRKRLGAGTTAAGSLFLNSITAQNDDTLRRLREDPLFLIRQAEYKQRQLESSRKRVLATAAATLHRFEETHGASSSEQQADHPRERKRSDDHHGHKKRSRSPHKSHSKHAKKKKRVSSHHRSRTKRDVSPRNCSPPQDATLQDAAINRTHAGYRGRRSFSPSPASLRNSSSRRPTRRDRRGHPIDPHPPSRQAAERSSFGPHPSAVPSAPNHRPSHPASPTQVETTLRRHRSPSRQYSSKRCIVTSSSSFSSPRSRASNSSPSLRAARHRSPSPSSPKIVKGPVRPLEWQRSEFPAQRHPTPRNPSPSSSSPASPRRAPSAGSSPRSYGVRSASQDSSSSGSLGPPKPMSDSVRRLRDSKGSVPFLWKSRNTVQHIPGPSSARQTKRRSPTPNQESDDVFKSCKDHLEAQDAQAKRLEHPTPQSQLDAMVQYGKKHEKEKALKLSHMEKLEQLQESIEKQTRGTTLQSAHREARFLQQATSDAYLQKDSTTLEDRLKRYAYRRRKSLLERNELDDEVA